jgi:hypothetical protein
MLGNLCCCIHASPVGKLFLQFMLYIVGQRDTLAATNQDLFMATKQMTKFLTVRLTPTDHKAFHRKADRYGKPSDLLREIVQAFTEDRLVIQPPVNPKESLYVRT